MSEVMNIPEGWEVKKINQIVKLNPESITTKYSEEFEIEYIDISSINDFKVSSIERLKLQNAPSRARRIVKDDYIIFSSVRPYLMAIAYIDFVGNKNNVVCSTGYVVMKPKDNILHSKYLFYYSQQNVFINEVMRVAEGSNYPAISDKEFKLLDISYPKEIKEQKKIAKILSTLDQAIEATQKLIEKEKNIKKGLMHDLLTNGIDQNGKIRSPQTHKYKESELGLIPEEWEVVELKDNLTYISYGFTNPMPTTENGPFMVTAADIKHGKISYQTCRKTSQEAFNNLLTQKSKPIKNDILLTKDGTLGRIALMDDSMVCINQSVALLRPNNQVDEMFLKHLLESPRYQKKILDDAGGSTIKHIYITIIDKMKLAQPLELFEQTQIANILTIQDKKIEIEEKNLAKLKALKKGLMDDLLSGKVRVKLLKGEK